jgi:hypothetical protein
MTVSQFALPGVVMGLIVSAGIAAPPEPPRDPESIYIALALKGITKEYPNKLEHVLGSAADLKSPRSLHPAFYGSYDWHSCVHGHWLLAHLLRMNPKRPEANAIREILNRHLTQANIAAEVAYFHRPESRSFERPYGWTWLLKLAQELHGWDDPDARTWSAALQPLTDVIVKRYLDFFPKQTYPIRTGVHANTAFGFAFAYDYAVATRHDSLKSLIGERARTYYRNDRQAPVTWEPSGADFLSPTLTEADLMRRILPRDEFAKWLTDFLPGDPKMVLTPAIVTDRTDPQLVHLDGLNLSRAWALAAIAEALPDGDRRRADFREAATRHAEAGRKHVASGDYAGEHWLASFAVYMDSVVARMTRK